MILIDKNKHPTVGAGGIDREEEARVLLAF
jgi:hypothetical protein